MQQYQTLQRYSLQRSSQWQASKKQCCFLVKPVAETLDHTCIKATRMYVNEYRDNGHSYADKSVLCL